MNAPALAPTASPTAPLVVRLRDLGPALSHHARAQLAVARIRRAATAQALAQALDEDHRQATDELYRLSADNLPIADFVPTVVVHRDTLIAYRPPATYRRHSALRRALTARLGGRHAARIGG